MKTIKDTAKRSLIISFALCFLYAIYAPCSIYFLNVDEFSYDIYDMLKMMLPVFAAGTIVLFIFISLVAFLDKKIYSAILAMLTVVLGASYFQGTFLSGKLPPMTGAEINWNNYDSQRIWSVMLWLGCCLIVFWIYKKLDGKKITAYFCAFLTIMLGMSLGITAISNDGLRNKADYITTYDGILELSDNSNFIILLLDAVNADTYVELCVEHPEYNKVFEDFTYYSNTLGAYPYTSRSIPFIITGKWYENEDSFYNYTNAAYSESPLLSRLEEKEYKINLFEPELMLNEENMQRFDNTVTVSGADFLYPLGFYKVQAQLVGYRFLPYDMKKMCDVTPAKISNSTIRMTGDTKHFDGANDYFYKNVCGEKINNSEQNVFSFIHLQGAHDPYVFSGNMEYSPETADYRSSVEASINIADAYLKTLKEQQKYDNSVIIIMSDHGINEGMEIDSEDSTGRQNPILFIKGRNEKHQYLQSDLPVSFDDLQEAYIGLIDGTYEQTVFKIENVEERQRRYLKYNLYDYTLYEYTQSGKADDPDSLIPTGIVFKE